MKTKKSESASSSSEDCGCDGAAGMPGESDAMRTQPGETDSAYAMPAAAAMTDEPSERGMPGMDASDGDRMPAAGMGADRDADGDSGMPGGGMGDGGGGGGDSGGDGQTPNVRTCGTMEVHRRLLSRFPEYARARDAIENLTLEHERGARSALRPGVTRIPVVVHVVWNTAAQNISDAQIASQIDVLNRDFRRTNPDVSSTPAAFLPLTADARVEFYLANVDFNGAATSGIERRQTPSASFTDNDAIKSAASGGANPWPADRYLNVWTAPRLTSAIGDLLGYAQFPGGPAATDGVVILHSAFGTTGTAAPPFHLGRTATHEIGHWLNLNHIWGDDGTGCAGTDNVADTPNQAGSNLGTPTFPHVSCSNGPNGDMFMNYMDYVNDPAMFMFTAGQVARMQACLDGPRSAIGPDAAGAPRQSSSPVVAWGANRLDVFVLGTDRALYHKWWNGSAWGPSLTGYEAMGGVCTSVPQVVAWGPNRLDVFLTGTDSALYHKWWNGSAWGPSLTGYEAMGGVCVGDPRVVSWGPNRLDVFVLGTDRALYHKWWNGSTWGPSLTGYERLGGVCMSAPRAVSWGPNRLDIFVTGTDGALYHKWWNGSAWGPSLTGFERMGGVCVGEPEAVSWGPNRLDLFVIGTDSALYHKWWNGSAWGPSLTGYEAMGGVCTSRPRVTAWGANRLDVFVTGTDSALYHKWWNGSAWGPSLTGYEAMGGVISSF